MPDRSPEPPTGWRTSESEPYAVDWIDLTAVPGLADAAAAGGGLGMSHAPGKYDSYWMHDRDVFQDVATLRDFHRVDLVVLLIEDHELDELRIAQLPAALDDAGIELVRHPIPDFGVPEDLDTYRPVVDLVLDRVRTGDRVVVACRGGFGRTGAVVGSMLVSAGVGSDEAVTTVREVRPGTIEMESQAEFVRVWSGQAVRGPAQR